jgi:hypothetical protein
MALAATRVVVSKALLCARRNATRRQAAAEEK